MPVGDFLFLSFLVLLTFTCLDIALKIAKPVEKPRITEPQLPLSRVRSSREPALPMDVPFPAELTPCLSFCPRLSSVSGLRKLSPVPMLGSQPRKSRVWYASVLGF